MTEITSEGIAGGAGSRVQVSPPTVSGAWWAVALMTAAYVVSLLDRTIITMMIEPIQRDLGISDTQFGLLHGVAFAIFYSIAGIPCGWLADRVSRRNLISAGVTLWSLATVLSGMAATYIHLFLARMGVGIGEATLNPAAYSMIADLFPKEKLGRAIATFSTGGLIGAGVAYLAGGSLISLVGNHPTVVLPVLGSVRSWQVIFLIVGIPGLVLAALFLSIREPGRRLEGGRAAGTEQSFLSFLKERGTIVFWLTAATSILLLLTHASLAWTPAMLIRVHDVGLFEIGLIMGAAVGIAGSSGYVAGGLLADRWLRRGRADAHLIVGVVGALAALPTVLVVMLSSDVRVVTIALPCYFFAVSFPTAASVAALQIVTPPGLRGLTSSIFMVAINVLGMGIGPLAVGLMTDYVFEAPEAVGQSVALLACLCVPAIVACYLLARSALATCSGRGRSIMLAS